MRSALIEIGSVFAEKPAQVILTKQQNMIKTLSPQTSNESLALLGCPLLRWMIGLRVIDDLPRIVRRDNEGENLTEANVVRLHEIAGPYLMCMIAKKRRPCLTTRRRALPSHSHVFLNCPFRDSDESLEQLTSNALSTPGAIVSRHLHD
jgi:hypothetical protein